MFPMCYLDKVSAQRLSEQVNEAVEILQKYNKRLADEMDERRRITTMFKDFIQAQQELLDQGEQRLEVRTKILHLRHKTIS